MVNRTGLKNMSILGQLKTNEHTIMAVMAVIVGLAGGFGAVGFRYLISVVQTIAYGSPAELLGVVKTMPWYAKFWIPALGGLVVGPLVYFLAREAKGHGVPEVMEAVALKGGVIRKRIVLVKSLASAISISTGGSVGREGPIVQIGSAIGSTLGQALKVSADRMRTLVGCGAAGAISSIFNAPIAGMVFAIEVILGEWKSVNIIPIAIASVAGTEISRILQGNQIAFSHYKYSIDLLDIFACLGLAILSAGASILLTRMLRNMHRISAKVPAPLWLRAAAGGCAVGIIGLFLPVVLGEGYHSIRIMIEGGFSHGLAFVALATLAKILATALTLGWGGSGGIFAPCLVIGSLLGVTYYQGLILLWPSVSWVSEGCFALLGMAGLISGMLQAPLTGIFLIVEITGGYEVILPLIVVSTITTTLCHYIEPASYYLKELVELGHFLRPGTDARVLSDLSIQEVIEEDCIIVNPNMLLRDFVDIVKISPRNYFPVEDEKTGHFLGIIYLDDIRPYLFNPGMYDAVILAQLMDTHVDVVNLDDDLPEVLRKMDAKRLFSLPVVSNNRFIGLISRAKLLDQYRKELMVQTSQQI